MKTKIIEGKKIHKNSRLAKIAHYFHADEDFREDKDWGKKSLQNDMILPKALKDRSIDLN
ncbi:hypothetical protein [Pedobacter nyackensis]|nr:hypothetical protein [Pedobacter nyackensis]